LLRGGYGVGEVPSELSSRASSSELAREIEVLRREAAELHAAAHSAALTAAAKDADLHAEREEVDRAARLTRVEAAAACEALSVELGEAEREAVKREAVKREAEREAGSQLAHAQLQLARMRDELDGMLAERDAVAIERDALQSTLATMRANGSVESRALIESHAAQVQRMQSLERARAASIVDKSKDTAWECLMLAVDFKGATVVVLPDGDGLLPDPEQVSIHLTEYRVVRLLTVV
jgi:hypothetical protein